MYVFIYKKDNRFVVMSSCKLLFGAVQRGNGDKGSEWILLSYPNILRAVECC